MGVVGFNSENLSGIIESLNASASKVHSIGEDISFYLADIRSNWTGDEANLAGREKDFDQIMNNVNIIETNIMAIANFLNEKKADFSKINYR